MSYLLRLEEITASQDDLVGPKAANLAKLLRGGLSVPRGFCITLDVYRGYVYANGLEDQIAQARATTGDPSELRQAFDSGRMLPELTVAVHAACEELGGPFAVRSSASHEDSAHGSFAGQHESYLNVSHADGVLDCIRKCWASLWTSSAVSYRSRWLQDPDSTGMAVIVQAFVQTDAAGLMFLEDPIDGNASHLIIESTRGLGDRLAAGLVTPEAFRIDKRSGRILTGRRSSWKFGTLDKTQIAALCKAAERIEGRFGSRVAIEWAFAEQELHILQCRPLPSLSPAAHGARWVSPVPGARWTRTWRLGEWLSGPLSPLFETLVVPELVEAREGGGSNHLGWRLPGCWTSKYPWCCVIHGYFFARADVRVPSFLLFLLATAPRIERAMKRWRDVDLPKYRVRLGNLEQFNAAGCTNSELWKYVTELCLDAAQWWRVLALDGGGAGFVARLFRALCARWLPNGPDAGVLLSDREGSVARAQQHLYSMAKILRANPALWGALRERPLSAEVVSMAGGSELLAALQSYRRDRSQRSIARRFRRGKQSKSIIQAQPDARFRVAARNGCPLAGTLLF